MFLKYKVRLLLLFIFIFHLPYLKSQEIFEHPEWSYNKVIYEVNLRQYTEEGTFKAFEEHLGRLKEMGVGILWFMPLHPIGEENRKGTLGSYYAVKDYKDINPEHGTHDDFKLLVEKIHSMGMYVLIDWVANHTSWDNNWTKEHPDFYKRDASGNFIPPVEDWSDVIALNYDNKELWKYMIDAMKFWIEEFNIDGFRCDVAGMVPLEFWLETRKELDKIKPVFMLAEAWEPELHQAFDMTYSWDIHHMMNEIAKGEKNVIDLKSRFEKEEEMYPENGFRMQFTSNHDENSWNGTVWERLGEGAEAFAALTFVIPGMPLIYSGQEAGLDKRLEFFEKDIIEWKKHRFYEIYSTLCRLKEDNKALWNGEKGGKIKYLPLFSFSSRDVEISLLKTNILAFERESEGDKILAVFNLSGERFTQLAVNTELNSGYRNVFTDEELKPVINLDPWGYQIFYKK